MTDKHTHTSDCDWHTDQYSWECTCGAIPKKQAMDNLIAQDADLIDAEPVAYRYGFDGYGWQYIDNGSGSDWTNRHPDGEPLYAHSPADRIEALEAEVERLRYHLEGTLETLLDAEVCSTDCVHCNEARAAPGEK